jgi:Fur family peroxide stress response transcriptional regulator
MKQEEHEYQQRTEHLKQVCSRAGVRLTHQRLEVFREVARSHDHPDAVTVHKRLRKRMPTISLDTVYRTLWLLNDLGLISTLEPSRERTRFDANLERHHHFVCSRCGMTRDFHSEEFDDLQLPPPARAFGRIEMTRVEVRGICRDCIDGNAKPQS